MTSNPQQTKEIFHFSQLSSIKWLPPQDPDGNLSQLLWFSGGNLYSPKEMGLSQDYLTYLWCYAYFEKRLYE